MNSENLPYATATPIPIQHAIKVEKVKHTTTAAISPKELDYQDIQQLRDQGYTEGMRMQGGGVVSFYINFQVKGLAKSLASNTDAFPLRIWIVDNSGSMLTPDGQRLVDSSSRQQLRFLPCSRWDEIRECVFYHIKMAALLKVSTKFRLLNNPTQNRANLSFNSSSKEFGVAEHGTEHIASDVQQAISNMNCVKPSGVTPLTQHIHEVYTIIWDMVPSLNHNGQRVVIVIATDGLPSDERGVTNRWEQEQFLQALRLLEGLPVWVVIRLCTNEKDVVNYYNALDEQLEISLEVLDDFIAEAKEVYERNPWINYSLPLHRCREMGIYDRMFDLMDERPFTKSEVQDFCAILFGHDKMDGVADPELDWDKFLEDIGRLTNSEDYQWNPIKNCVMPVVNIKKLKKAYGGTKKRGILFPLKRRR